MSPLIEIMNQHEQGIGEDTAAWTSDLAVKPAGDLTGATVGMGQSFEVALGSRDGDAARWVSEQGPWLS